MTSVPQGRGTGSSQVLLALAVLGAMFLFSFGLGVAEAKSKCTKRGTNGPDILKGTKHKDVLCGRGGADILIGKKGGDTLKGGGGADILIGEKGSDRLIAGGGGDALTGGPGDDTLKGGKGTDSAAFSDASASVVIDLPGHSATGVGNDKLGGVEDVIGSAGNDTITGDSSPNKIIAGAGDDMIIASAGNDTVMGESGVDSLSYAAAATGVQGGLDSGSISGDATGSDTVSGIEALTGSAHDDVLVGDDRNDTISGAGGADLISGGYGDDLLNGEGGDDQLFGEGGNDSLHGGANDDMIDGGGGINACDGGTGTNTYAGNCDMGAPTLVDLTVSPATIDTFGSEQIVTFTIDASDDLAGVDAANSQITVHNPSGPTRSVPLTLSGGDALSGVFSAEFTVPRYASQGLYAFDVTLTDKNGNSKTMESQALIAEGHPGSFLQTGTGDSSAPDISGLTVNPASIDTAQAARTVDFTLQLSDDLSGVDAASSWISVLGPSGPEAAWTPLVQTAGSDTFGTYTGQVMLPRYSAQGIYKLDMKLVDKAGNEIRISPDQLSQRSLPSSFHQTGIGDTTPPSLFSFNRTPATTDTREGAQTMTVSIGATDTLAGVDLGNTKVIIRDPNGIVDSTTPVVAAGSNTYQAKPVIAKGSAPGIWTIDIVLYDTAGNYVEYNSTQLTQLGFQSTFQNLGIQGT